jgi:cell division protein FtsW (lipid II flippase)
MSIRALLLLVTGFPVAASCAVLAVAGVGVSVWTAHVAYVVVACVLASLGLRVRVLRGELSVVAIPLILIGLTVPLMGDAVAPERWLTLGPFSVYAAPLVLPSLFVVCVKWFHEQRAFAAGPALIVASGLLACQPDASQALALLLAAAVLLVWYRAAVLETAVVLAVMVVLTVWTFTRPDPLKPVPHVEGVFAVALEHSLWLGLAVIAIAGLAFLAHRRHGWLAAVAAYYAVLFACSVAGLTPAPLIGFGAGPLLGFGLLLMVSDWVAGDARGRNRQPSTV